MKHILIILILITSIINTNVVNAYAYNFKYTDFYRINLNDSTAKKGFTIQAFNDEFRFGITPNLLTAGGAFEFKEVELLPNSGMEIPEGYKLVSKIIEFDVKNKKVYNPDKPFWLQMKYDSDLMFDKFLFYFDSGKGRWIELPSKTDFENKIVKSAFHLPYAKLAVFDTNVMKFGKASWYRYKSCLCAASPDYPKGTELLVVNLNKNEAIKVIVNDWGPERDIFPDRVIDLDLLAFTKFASKGTGVLQNIYVTPFVETDFTEEELNVIDSKQVLQLTQERLIELSRGEIQTNEQKNELNN